MVVAAPCAGREGTRELLVATGDLNKPGQHEDYCGGFR
jgi:hypothetical protein